MSDFFCKCKRYLSVTEDSHLSNKTTEPCLHCISHLFFWYMCHYTWGEHANQLYLVVCFFVFGKTTAQQARHIVGPASQTLGQHWSRVVAMCRVCWAWIYVAANNLTIALFFCGSIFNGRVMPYETLGLAVVCVLFRGKRGAVCGKRLTFLYTSPYEHVEYNVWGA